jgi:probable blue pigment (indigoidine) exporter
VAAARVVPAGLALVAGGSLASRWRPRGPEWARTAVLALFNFGLFFPLLIVAVYRLPGGVAATAGGLQPLLVAAGSWPATGHRPRARDLTIGLAAALGVTLVVIRPSAGLDPVGVLAAIAANMSFAAGVVLTRRLPAPAPAHRLAATGWQLLLGGALLVPLASAVEGRPPALTGANVAGFAYLSLIGTAWPSSCGSKASAASPPPRPPPRPRRAGHRRTPALGDPPPVAVADPARRLRAHPQRHCPRGIARRVGRGGRRPPAGTPGPGCARRRR